MTSPAVRRTTHLVFCLVSLVLAPLCTGRVNANPIIASDVIDRGWDLYHTASEAVDGLGQLTFGGLVFRGEPLGTFDFRNGQGPVETFNTDTIVRRLNDASLGHPAALVMEARQLASEDGSFFLTLETMRGLHPTDPDPHTGRHSTGHLTITFDAEPGPCDSVPVQPIHGSFVWAMDMFFDIRAGRDGPIVMPGQMTTLSGMAMWSHCPPEGAVELPGVNVFLRHPGDRSGDFFPIGSFAGLETATVPEPATIGLLAFGLTAVGVRCRRRRR